MTNEAINKMKGNLWNGEKYLQIVYLTRFKIQNKNKLIQLNSEKNCK